MKQPKRTLAECTLGITLVVAVLLLGLFDGTNKHAAYADSAATPTPQTASPEDPMKQYQGALALLDNVVASIVLINTPQGQRGLTRGDVDELRHCTLLLSAALKELEEAKAPKVEPAPVATPEPPADK